MSKEEDVSELKEELKIKEKKMHIIHKEEEEKLKAKHKEEEEKLKAKHKEEEEKLRQKHKREEEMLKKQDLQELKKGKPFKIKIKKQILYALAVCLIIILIIVLFFVFKRATKKEDYGVVNLEFYVMSQCPYGIQVEEGIAPVLKKLGKSVNFSLNFIGNYNGDSFSSLHGESEVNGNKVQLCALKHNPEKAMDFISCMNKNPREIPGNWKACAQQNSLDIPKIEECYNGEEGKMLLKASFDLARKRGATGSPTMYLNNELYTGGRDENSFLRAICSKLNKHPVCLEIPACSSDIDCKMTGKVGKCINPNQKDARCEFSEPNPVNVVVLNDKRCKDCDVSRLIPQLTQLFPGLKVKEVDYSSEEGKKLFTATNVKFLPAILFHEEVTKEQAYAQISQYFEKKGDYLLLRIGSSFDPTSEICDNKIDDNNNSLIDCEDSDCEKVWECVRKTEKPIVELFVMSHCPYGLQIEKGIIPVAELLGDKIDLKIKFVNYAMHGEKEITEQMRQYCIQSEMPDKFIKYLKCFLEDGNSERCLKETKIDVQKLNACVEKTDAKFGITKDFKDKSTWMGNFPRFKIHDEENEKYDIRGSPSLVINGAQPNTGRDANSLLKTICYAFKTQPEECKKDLSKEGNPSPGFGFSSSSTAAQANAGCGV